MAPRYDRLFYLLLVLVLVGGFAAVRASLVAIVGDVAGAVHGAARNLAYRPQGHLEELVVYAMLLIVIVALAKLWLARSRAEDDSDR